MPAPPRRKQAGDRFTGEDGAFQVLPENEAAVAAFIACGSQWRFAPTGFGAMLAGLDYSGCRAAVAALGLKWRAVFDGLWVMEAEVMSEQRKEMARRKRQ